jgi:hypothetical protein
LIVLPALQEAQANHKLMNDSRSKGQRGKFVPVIVSMMAKICSLLKAKVPKQQQSLFFFLFFLQYED